MLTFASAAGIAQRPSLLLDRDEQTTLSPRSLYGYHPLRPRSTISNSSSGNSQEMDSAEVSTAVNEPLDLVKLSLSECVCEGDNRCFESRRFTHIYRCFIYIRRVFIKLRGDRTVQGVLHVNPADRRTK